LGTDPVKFHNNGKPRILFAPLDWGLGHATRSIPLLKYLIEKDFEIIIACKSNQKNVLAAALPEAHFEPLKSYSIRLGKTRWLTRLQLVLQAPKFWMGIWQERRMAEQLIKKYHPSLILSDNCYGFRSKNCRSVLLTHQLSIRTGWGSLADQLLSWWNRRKIQAFDECWIPDTGRTTGLAGTLSTPAQRFSLPLVYLGGLSRWKACALPPIKNGTLLILLSGPEPQRSLLEQKILSQALMLKQKTILIRGVSQGKNKNPINEWLTVIDFMEGPELQECLCTAEWVICRSGYSTLMDLVRLQAKAVLVPTPGQAEQEYLAHHFSKNQWALSIEQEIFELKEAIAQAKQFPYQLPDLSFETYKEVIDTRITG
jgi:UDP-N-acetylglucosamine transferase subunit ALG13